MNGNIIKIYIFIIAVSKECVESFQVVKLYYVRVQIQFYIYI